jgi:hypothetical protein
MRRCASRRNGQFPVDSATVSDGSSMAVSSFDRHDNINKLKTAGPVQVKQIIAEFLGRFRFDKKRGDGILAIRISGA